MIWNNRNIRIKNGPVFYKRYLSCRILTENDLHYNIITAKSYELFGKNIEKSNISTWIGPRHSVPLDLRNPVFHRDLHTSNPSFKIGSGVLDANGIKF